MARSAATNRVTIPQTQNFLKYSQDMGNALGWTGIGTTLESNSTLSPDELDRLLIATKLTETAILNVHYVYHFPQGTMSLRKGAVYTASCYLKDGTRGFGGIFCDLGASNVVFLVNLTTGAVTNATSTNQAHIVSTEVLDKGSGWFRIAVTFYLDVPLSQFTSFGIMSPNGTTIFYLGDITKNMYITGAQMVEGNRMGPPVLTTSSAVNTGPLRNKTVSRVATNNRIIP